MVGSQPEGGAGSRHLHHATMTVVLVLVPYLHLSPPINTKDLQYGVPYFNVNEQGAAISCKVAARKDYDTIRSPFIIDTVLHYCC